MLSMTGFGRAEAEEQGNRVWVEVRSVNNRFCVVNVRLPELLAPLEWRVSELVRRHIARGRVEVTVDWKAKRKPSLVADLSLAEAYRDSLLELKKSLHLAGKIDIPLLASLPGVIVEKRDEVIPESLWELVKRVCQVALDEHLRMRKAEGEKIQKDIAERIRLVDEIVQEIEKLAPLEVQQQRDRLNSRLQDLLVSRKIDEQRLAMEIALIAERSDVTEECTRLHSHNAQFLKTLSEEGPVGRKLDFLLQEIHREANTVGAKADSTSISHLVIRMKEEAEKIREQVQNVE
ncbi:MAG: YicC family protein [Candidatus Latescibacteria bacterium 4484_181]|nr:MAG: YicC family protein [Candidatus Latescibacteria bacterium 4484_181]RKY69068.1 MAG: YicC family protein [Candidatus Latescibacterota bacterium]RKY72836.1 MAG: YicC family protein [Candidatus Latescibacterota bacterium]